MSIKPFLKQISQASILFIHGTNDLLIPLESVFDEIFESASSTDKVALITPFGHVDNIQSNPASYKFVCDQFIMHQTRNAFIQAVVAGHPL